MSELAATAGRTLAPLFLICIVLVTAAAAVQTFRFMRKIKADACRCRCSQCRRFLNAQSVDLADARWRQYLAQLMQAQPDRFFRIARSVFAVCETCGAEFNYVERERKLVLNAERVLDVRRV
jgi:hypothetical protein